MASREQKKQTTEHNKDKAKPEKKRISEPKKDQGVGRTRNVADR